MHTAHGAIASALWTKWTGEDAVDVVLGAVVADRGATGAVYRCKGNGREAIVKIPHGASDPARSLREAFVLANVTPSVSTPTPELLASMPCAQGTACLLSVCPGVDGDMAAGADIGLAERVLEAITPVHALPIDPGWELHLPKWGQGTREATRRHVRRVTRFDRRRQACIEAWGHASDRSWLASLSDHLLATMESDCTTVTVGPPRVLHGDLHGDNLRIAGSAIALLDWQSTSLGPPVIDTVNWLALHSTLATAEACLSLGQLHLEAVSAWPGLDVWHAAMRLSLSSLMSGYATRGPDVVSQREAVYVRQQLSRDGLAGVLHASLQK